MGEMSRSGNALSSWSWEENKLFELALAVTDESSPERWKEVASMIGGKKSAEEVEQHYKALLEDLDFIESGRLDLEVEDAINCAQETPWTDADQELLMKMKIK